jgi:uncharacterized protein
VLPTNHYSEEKRMKKATTACIVAMVLIALIGCGKDNDSASQAPPEPPSVSLHEAAIVGNVAAIKQHVAAGSNLDEKDAYGSSPLIAATTFGVTETAQALIDNGADLSVANNDGSTPLHIAALLCYTDIVESLLAAGADKDLLNGAGHTALDLVAGPFADSKPIYDGLGAALGPLGLKLDYKYIEATRPEIAGMLRS